MTEIQHILTDRSHVVMTDNQIVPVTNWLDEFGDECEPAEAVAAVAGPVKPDGMWFSFDIEAFEHNDA